MHCPHGPGETMEHQDLSQHRSTKYHHHRSPLSFCLSTINRNVAFRDPTPQITCWDQRPSGTYSWDHLWHHTTSCIRLALVSVPDTPSSTLNHTTQRHPSHLSHSPLRPTTTLMLMSMNRIANDEQSKNLKKQLEFIRRRPRRKKRREGSTDCFGNDHTMALGVAGGVTKLFLLLSTVTKLGYTIEGIFRWTSDRVFSLLFFFWEESRDGIWSLMYCIATRPHNVKGISLTSTMRTCPMGEIIYDIRSPTLTHYQKRSRILSTPSNISLNIPMVETVALDPPAKARREACLLFYPQPPGICDPF